MAMLWYIAGVFICAHTGLAAVISFAPLMALRDGTSPFSAEPLDYRYDRWTDPSNILYYLDSTYSEAEQNLIHGALMTISFNMDKCIHFQEYNQEIHSGRDFLYISQTLNDGTTPPTCVSFLGRVTRAEGKGQKLVMHNGENGCMGSMRDILRTVVNALGLRNEYRRPDRDLYINVYTENLVNDLKGSSLLEAYNESDVYYGNFPFDYFSITMPSVTKYAADNAVIYSLPGNGSITYVDQLSLDDCLGLAWIYGCSTQACKNPYNDVELNFSPNANPSPSTRNVSYVLLSPSNATTPLSASSGQNANTFHVVALDRNAASSILGHQMTPSGDAMNGQVNVTFVMTGANSTADHTSFVLNGQTSVAGVQPMSGAAVTLNLKNVSNATALVGIYGPAGYKGEVSSPTNSSALVVNLNSTDLLTTTTETTTTLTSSTTTTAVSQPLFP